MTKQMLIFGKILILAFISALNIFAQSNTSGLLIYGNARADITGDAFPYPLVSMITENADSSPIAVETSEGGQYEI